MALVLIKGHKLYTLDTPPDAWTGEMFVPPNQAYTLIFLLHLSLCRNYHTLKTQASCRRKTWYLRRVWIITPQGYDASKKCLCFHRGENYKICEESASNKEKERKCKHQPLAYQRAMPCFLEARLKAQAYTVYVWFVLGCLKCRTCLHGTDPRGPGSLIRKTCAPVLKPG